jgi:hypothetical protein
VGQARRRREAYRLAIGLARLTFTRGMPGESQRRYEQAAELAADDRVAADRVAADRVAADRVAADAWRSAAGAAESRHFGNDALLLLRRAADAALRAGDRAGAAGDLARSAELINRGPGLLASLPAAGEVEALLNEGRTLAGDDLAAQARLLTAEAFNGAIADPGTGELVDRALAMARSIQDPLIESAALDQLTAIRLARGDVRAAAASAVRRTELLAPMQVTADAALEFFDGLGMAAECAVAAGDLRAARGLAERLRDLPFHREEGHLATARLLLVTVLTGDWALATPGRPLSEIRFGAFFDALLLLHRGLPQQAVQVLDTPPEELNEWHNGLWRPWYAALWAEAAVLCRHEDAVARLARARSQTVGNPIAAAIVDRAAALERRGGGGRDGLTAAAAALEDAGCRYQWARTLVVIGGESRVRGESVLATMGATAMAWPPE